MNFAPIIVGAVSACLLLWLVTRFAKANGELEARAEAAIQQLEKVKDANAIDEVTARLTDDELRRGLHRGLYPLS